MTGKEKLWQKSSVALDPVIERYTIGDDYTNDAVFMPYDIAGCAAHAKGLAKIGVITNQEKDILLEGLEALKKEWDAKTVIITPEDEDCHTVIERYLTKSCRDVGKKIHTGRSRNDQILVAVRLYMKGMLGSLAEKSEHLAHVLLAYAKQHEYVPLPGYSHTQQAMLSSVGHYFCGYLESLLDDRDFFQAVSRQIDKNPLGSAAGFGVALPLDREYTSRELGFSDVQINSLYCQSSRGKYEALYLHAIASLMQTMEKIASDMILFTSREFGFFSVADTCVTGSSIMPQKRNLDCMELVRGNSAIVRGNLATVMDLSSHLISGYHRDLQLIKKPLIESTNIALDTLDVVAVCINALSPNPEAITRAIKKDIFSADIATIMATKEGIPFRDAYRIACDRVAETAVDLQENIRSKISLGAPGNLAFDRYEKRLNAKEQRHTNA
ncbi:argininosuccinate lyase [Candidatus Uhrbacteria bacterium]|nr:argininosuccinate lyase [Candidatus Uhrbacteria bacterium]